MKAITFDLMAVGTKWIEGCYCLPDAALKGALQSLTKNYQYILIDSPAGLEHLNRKITDQVNDIFDVMGPSNKSFENVKRSYKIIREIKIDFDHFYTVGGCLFPEGAGERHRRKDRPALPGENRLRSAGTGIRHCGEIAP